MPRRKKPGPKPKPKHTSQRIAPLPITYIDHLANWITRTNRLRRERSKPLITMKSLINTLIRRARADYAADARRLWAQAEHALRLEIGIGGDKGPGFINAAVDKELAERIATYLPRDTYPYHARPAVIAYLLRGWMEARVLRSFQYVNPIPANHVYWARADVRDWREATRFMSDADLEV